MQGYGPSSYGDGIADTYDAWYGDNPQTDLAVGALVDLTERSGSSRLLELGIGSGRLALPLAARGIDVCGVDASDAMVEQLRVKPGGRDVPVAIGDMAALDLSSIEGGNDARFGVVVAAINTFFNLTSTSAQQQCLERVHDVLTPRGFFVIEAFVPDVDRGTNVVEARTVELDRVVLSASRHDHDAQTVHVQLIDIRETGIRLRPLVIHYLTLDQLDAIAVSARLELAERWRDWSRTPFAEGDEAHVSVYRRSEY